MTKGRIKVEHENLARAQSPIHLHISDDAPVHLHFEPPNYCGSESANHIPGIQGSKSKHPGPYQLPWVPPPAKTSKGKLANVTKRPPYRKVKVTEPRRSTSVESMILHPDVMEARDASPRGTRHYDIDRMDSTENDRRRFTTVPSAENARFTGEPIQKHFCNMDKGRSAEDMETGALWTTSVVEQWAHDVENSITHMARAARSLEQSLDEIVADGRRLTTRDITCLNQPKDDLVLHGEIAIRAGRELCRWATSVKQQQDRFLTRKFHDTSSRESAMECEIHRLKELLDRTTLELEQTRKRFDSQQNDSAKFTSATESLEAIRAHLQRELRQRESDCNRLSTQVRGLESRLAEERAVLRTRLEAATATVAQLTETKEALKRAARAQKKRADQAEKAKDLVERLERTDTRSISGTQVDQDDKRERDDEHGGGQMGDGASRSYSPCSSKQRTPRDARMANAVMDKCELQEENEHLRSVAAKCERRLVTAEREMEELRASLMQCETMLHEQQRDSDAQAHQLRTLTEQLQEAEIERKRSQEQFAEIERRLRDSEEQNRGLVLALESVTRNGLAVRPEGQMYRQEAGLEEETPTRMQVRNDSRDVSEKVPTCQGEAKLIDELRRQLAEARYDREQAEHTAEIRAADLRAQLTQADATNRSLQAYLTFLKRSYASVFQPDLAQLFGGSTNGINFNMFKSGTQNGAEMSNLSHELSPQDVTREKHR